MVFEGDKVGRTCGGGAQSVPINDGSGEKRVFEAVLFAADLYE